ncbi:MAG: hypothetical protein ACJ71Y_06305 [Blastococcus sp.]
MATAEAPAAATVGPVPRVRRSRVTGVVVLLTGLLVAASNCTFVFHAMSPSGLDPVNR